MHIPNSKTGRLSKINFKNFIANNTRRCLMGKHWKVFLELNLFHQLPHLNKGSKKNVKVSRFWLTWSKKETHRQQLNTGAKRPSLSSLNFSERLCISYSFFNMSSPMTNTGTGLPPLDHFSAMVFISVITLDTIRSGERFLNLKQIKNKQKNYFLNTF